jgi:two-component system response regulator AtoC
MIQTILIVDDEKAIRDSLCFALEDKYHVVTACDPNEVYNILSENEVSVVLLDMKLGRFDGLEVLRKIKNEFEGVEVIMMTAFGSIKSSVQAIREGALNYLTKPIEIEELNVFIDKAIQHRTMSGSLLRLRQMIDDTFKIKGIVGNSESLNAVLVKIRKIKDIDSTVLITGESGTGKDLVAKAIHFEGRRKSGNIVIVNCAAIPANLIESELFGYEKGAFTGADRKHIGKIQMADNGTLFLDEIGELDLALQSKLLRVVEDMKVTPLGSNKAITVDFRLIAATNKNLEEEVKQGRFREDLYYRLNVITLNIPPLRERKGDIPLLIKYFVDKYNEKLNQQVEKIDRKVTNSLERYSFPGNIRELENLIERLVALSEDGKIEFEDLPDKYRIEHSLVDSKEKLIIPLGMPMKEIERAAILKTLDYFEGNKKKTAECLGISERNLHYKLKEYENQ